MLNKKSLINYINYGVFASYLSLVFSPLLSFIGSIFLFFFSRSKSVRVALYVPIVVSFSLISISRKLFITFKDDYQTYFENYLSLLQGGGEERFGLEVAWPTLNILIGSVFGSLPPRLLLLIYVLIQITIVVCFIELFIIKFKLRNNANEFAAILISLLPVLSFSVTIRHNVALLLLATCLLIKNKVLRSVGVIVASLFHLSVLPISLMHIFIFKLARKSWLYILLGLSIGVGSFVFLLRYIIDFPKVRAFFIYDLTFEPVVFLTYYKYVLFSFLLCFTLKNETVLLLRKNLFLIICFAFSLDWFLPYISFRVFQLVIILSGAFLYLIYIQFNSSLNQILIYRVRFIFIFLLKTLFLLINDSEFALFTSFSWGDIHPFYYLDAIVETIYERNRTY